MHMHFLSPQSTSKKLHISTFTYNLLLTNCKAVMYKSIDGYNCGQEGEQFPASHHLVKEL